MAPSKLAAYQRMRDFSQTAEPSGERARVLPSKALRFVVQKHAASHLHFDLRLEYDGTFRSWAVPKGPSLDPKNRRLAMEVEDHPLDYGDFEGTIPQGQYGGGTVMVWDRGYWAPEKGFEKIGAALARGELKFVMEGDRLHGSWVLVRFKADKVSKSKPGWMLIKHRDEGAVEGDVGGPSDADRSVASRRTMTEIAEGKRRKVSPFMTTIGPDAAAVWESSHKRDAAAPNPSAKGTMSSANERALRTRANLVSNAIKFTSLGKVTVTARLTAEGRVRLKVSDTGIGFDVNTSANIFARFQQADGSITRRFGGTGLGLSISRDLVILMGGTMACSSVPGVGSEFWADLPFVLSEGDQPDPLGVDPSAPLDRAIRILVADDHAINLKVVALILDQAGIETETVENGFEAVAAFRAGSFDAVLMDMQMPVMDGLTAIREIRKIERDLSLGHTPIAVLSANAMAEHIATAIQAGADIHIAKPIKPTGLLDTLERMLAEPGSAEQDGVAVR